MFFKKLLLQISQGVRRRKYRTKHRLRASWSTLRGCQKGPPAIVGNLSVKSQGPLSRVPSSMLHEYSLNRPLRGVGSQPSLLEFNPNNDGCNPTPPKG